MTLTADKYTLDDVKQTFVRNAARYAYSRYHRWVELEDCEQEINAWLYKEGSLVRVERWLASDPQQTTRIRMSLGKAATDWAAREKALKAGYHPSDNYFYTVAKVEEVLPLALNDGWDGSEGPDRPSEELVERRQDVNHAEAGDLVAAVMDVRLAAGKVGTDPAAIVSYLNNTDRTVGSRRVRSNATAVAEVEG